NKLMEQMISMCEMVGQLIQKKQEEKQIQEDQATNARYWKIHAYYDDDDDYNFAITPNETYSRKCEDSYRRILSSKSSFPQLQLEIMNGAHVGYNCPAQVPSFQTLPSFPQQYPCCEDCGVLSEADHCQPPQYTVNLQSRRKKFEEEQAANAQYWKISACCDDDGDYNSAITPNEPVDSLSMGDEYLNTISATESDEFIKSSVENLVPNPKSLLNHDSSIIFSSLKIDSLLDEFAGELTLLKSIRPGIDKTDCYPEEDICILERLLYDNSSSLPPEEFFSENSNADIESFSPSPIPIKDSDSFMEEIDLPFTLDDPMPQGIEDDDDSGRDIRIHEEFLDKYSLSLPAIESFYFDIPLFSRPPVKPPDGNTGILNIKIMGDNSEQKYSWKCEDSYQRILSSKSSFPQLQLGIMYLNLID
nr:hypothetical protein [Tanacetum cinerariifolium]